MAAYSDVDCERIDIVSKRTFYSVTAFSRFTYKHDCYGGFEGRIVKYPRATESKGRHNENFKQYN
jgi:hypothetical protein